MVELSTGCKQLVGAALGLRCPIRMECRLSILQAIETAGDLGGSVYQLRGFTAPGVELAKLARVKMTVPSKATTQQVDTRRPIVASIILVGALIAAVLSAFIIVKRLDAPWQPGHPWSTAASILGPAMLACLGGTFASVGPRKRILRGIAIALALAVAICSIIGLSV